MLTITNVNAITYELSLEQTARRIAAETLTDVRTVRKALAGQPVRGMTGKRIQAALAALDRTPVAVDGERS